MSQNNELRIWKINGLEYEIDLEDLETAEKYDAASKVLQDANDELQKRDGTLSEIIGPYCDTFYRFFDTLLGEGEANKIFSGKKNKRIINEVYFGSFAEFIKKQSAAVRDSDYSYANKYRPNREQRRSQGRHNYHNGNYGRRN